MSAKEIKLRGDLEGVTVEMDATRQITRVTKNGKKVICRETPIGTVCKLAEDTIAGPGQGPALQLRVTKKSLFARSINQDSAIRENAGPPGFQRHSA